MINVLYIGHFLEGTGYSEAAKNYVHALYRCGFNVICRNIKLNSSRGETSDLVIELLNKPLNNITICIQHILAHHMSYNSAFKNIGLFVYDTYPVPYEWAKQLNLMDQLWVPTDYVAQSIPSYVTKPIHVVPHCSNPDKFTRQYQHPVIPEIHPTYKFYYVGEANKRKNVSDIVKAFHCEFKRNESVSLILKTSIPGLSPDESARIISEECNKIKMETRLYPSVEHYKPEVIITNRISEEQLNGLHQYTNCFVSASRGEAWSQPLYDSYAFGNDVIYYDNESTSMYPYLENRQQGRISVDSEPVYGYHAPFQFICTAREKWLSSDIPALQSNMRLNYEEWLVKKNSGEKIEKHNVDVSRYSYSAVGSLMKGLLSE